MPGMETAVTFFTRGIYLIKPAASVRRHYGKGNLQQNGTVITACFVCVCEIIVTSSSGDDEVGALFDNNTTRKQQQDGANEGDAP